MDLLTCVLFFIFGSAIGSFLGAYVDRSQNGESIVRGRSHCDHCRHMLHWIDLIPLLSFILLRGKCRYCHKKLSFQYPVIEAVTGALFVLTFTLMGQEVLSLVYYLFIIASLIIIFFTDLKFGLIPFRIVFPAVIASLLYIALTNPALLPNALLSAFGAFFFFLFIYYGTIIFLKKEGMGFGDVVYVFLMGLVLGFPKIVLGLYIAFLTGAFISIILVMMRQKKFKGGSVPFGPFLILGTIVSLFWGTPIIEKILIFLF